MFFEMDGRFPNHHPDPTQPENLQHLVAAVLESKADVGLAFDGDSDRIGAVDEKGTILYGDQLMIIYAREILSRKPGATVIGEVKSSQNMYDDIRKHGGDAIMWKTGHSLIKARMQETNAELAGEMSGHMFFADRYYGFDDALYAACRLLEIVSNSGEPLSSQLSDLPPTFATPEIRVDCPDEKKFAIVSAVLAKFQARLRRDRNRRRADQFRQGLGSGAGIEYAAGAGVALRGAVARTAGWNTASWWKTRWRKHRVKMRDPQSRAAAKRAVRRARYRRRDQRGGHCARSGAAGSGDRAWHWSRRIISRPGPAARIRSSFTAACGI